MEIRPTIGQGYRLPLRNRLLYASGSLGSQTVLQALLLWTVFFYAPTGDTGREAALPLGLVGALIFAGRIVDVVTDPLVGAWSDRTRSRWGRRIPFILMGAPIMAIAFVLVWTPPGWLPPGPLAAYLFLTLALFFLGHTLSGRPYDVLLPEITPHSLERVTLAALRVVMGIIGATLGLVVSSLLIGQAGFLVMGLLLGFVALATRYAAVAGVWRWTVRNALTPRLNLPESFALIARNRPFRFYLPSFILFSMGLSILTQLIPFHVSTVLQQGEQTVSLVTGIFLVAVVLSLPLMTRLAARWNKRLVYGRTMIATGLVLPALAVAGFLPSPAPLVQLAVVVAILGVTMSSAFLFPAALMADIIDHDAATTGHRREASYYGTEQGIQKIGIGLSTIVLTQVLETFGHTPENPLGIQMIGPITAVLVLLGGLVFIWGYRLDPQPRDLVT